MSWISKQLLLTSILLLLVILSFEFSNLDVLLQDRFFDFQTDAWWLARDEPITKFLLYDGIKFVYVVGALGLLAFVAFFGNFPTFRSYKKGLVIVVISLFIVPGVVNLAKAVSNVPCPRDLTHYGGDYPHVTLLKAYPDDFQQERNIACYPAGHASGGFALLSLFFLFREKKHRTIAVVSALSLAWTIGFYKMVIGDHFLSHTLVTMLLSWLLILIAARLTDPRLESLVPVRGATNRVVKDD